MKSAARHALGLVALGCLGACAGAPAPASVSPAAPPAPTTTTSAPAATGAIRAAALSARIRFLSDDLLEGRFTGSRGHAIAERYVASEMQAMGLEPAGDQGSYLQAVPLRGAMKDPASAALALAVAGQPELAFKNEQDFTLASDLYVANVDVTAPIVFAGYGVHAPEYGWDDYAGVDVKGKIVVVFSSAPLSDKADFFPPIAHALYADRDTKAMEAAKRGAVGLISVFRPEDEERLPWARVTKSSRIEEMDFRKGDALGWSPKGMPVRARLHWKTLDAILARAGVKETTASLSAKADARALKSFDVPAKLHEKLTTKLRDFDGHNVVAVLRGSDPQLASEYVVLSAHLDHVGVGAPFDGDAIYNGALDNASGTASILEIARAFAALPQRPKRSLLFLSCTGEERGLLGSSYFAQRPTVPAKSIVADLNSDMILALAPPLRDVVVLGGDHSSLGAIADGAARSLGLITSPDPEPKQAHFVRSDQYSFVREGIPSIDVEAGMGDAPALRASNEAKAKAWIANRYHAPKDEWDPTYDYEGMAQVARVNFLVALSVADAKDRPQWNANDVLTKLVDTLR